MNITSLFIITDFSLFQMIFSAAYIETFKGFDFGSMNLKDMYDARGEFFELKGKTIVAWSYNYKLPIPV